LRELALHIMDIIENGINAGAGLIRLNIQEDRRKNRLRITIQDNGRGIPREILDKVTDPFFTTRTARRVGLGLSLFREASKRCGGEFKIDSRPGEGTTVEATFQMDHIDLAPMGDLTGALTTLMMGSPEVDFLYTHEIDGRRFVLDTREIRETLDGVPLNNARILKFISDMIEGGVEEIRGLQEKGGEGIED